MASRGPAVGVTLLLAGVTLVGTIFAVACYLSDGSPMYGDELNNIAQAGYVTKFGLVAYGDPVKPYLFPFLTARWISVVGPDPARLHTVTFATNLVAHVAASFVISWRLGRVFQSAGLAVVAYAFTALNPFLLILTGEMLGESLLASALGLSIGLTLGTHEPGERPGIHARMAFSLFLAGVATMLHPAGLAVVLAVSLVWLTRWLVFRDVPWQGWIVGVAALTIPFVPQVFLNAYHFGVFYPLVTGGRPYAVDTAWGVQNLKYAGVVVGDTASRLVYVNPLVPPGVVESLDFRRASPLGYLATLALHLFALVDVDFPFVYVRDLDPWYRWPLSFLNYAYLCLGAIGAWGGLRYVRDRKTQRHALAILAGVFAAIAYTAAFLPVVAESRYGAPVFMLLAPAAATGLPAVWQRVRERRWSRLLRYAVVFTIVIGSFGALSAWMQDQAPVLQSRPRVAVASEPFIAEISARSPAIWAPGEVRNYRVDIRNGGYGPWLAHGEHRVRVGALFGTARSFSVADASTDQLFDLPADVGPGVSQRVTIRVRAPNEPGCYYLMHRLVLDGKTWVRSLQFSPVLVASPAPDQRARNRSGNAPPCEVSG